MINNTQHNMLVDNIIVIVYNVAADSDVDADCDADVLDDARPQSFLPHYCL